MVDHSAGQEALAPRPPTRWAGHKQAWAILVLVLLVGFLLRLHNLNANDFTIDETWSYVHSVGIAHPSGSPVLYLLAEEPNNDLHLVLMSLLLQLDSNRFSARLFSVLLGTITIALTARLAHNLYGSKAALAAALLTSLALAPITFSQTARPYMLSTTLGLLSLVLWSERRLRLNMIASAFVPLAHIGAMPMVVIQDLYAIHDFLTKRSLNFTQWIVYRIPTYAMFGLVVFATYLRRSVHVISAGQPLPSLADIAAQLLHTFATNAMIPLLLVFFLLPAAIAYLRSAQRKNLTFPLVWMLISIAYLVVGAVMSDGPIKWIHLAHLAIASILLVAAVLASLTSPQYKLLLATYSAVALVMLNGYYSALNAPWRKLDNALRAIAPANTVIYMGQDTTLWALQLNTAHPYQRLPAMPETPGDYVYLDRAGWYPPPPPPECTEIIWKGYEGYSLLHCTQITEAAAAP